MQETKAREDEVIYADDTDVIAEQDTITQISQKLVNYSTVSFSRDVNINWGKVGIIARTKGHGELIAGLPHPFSKAIMGTTGNAIGEEIDIDLPSCEAIKERLHKERQSWDITRGNFFY